MTEERKPRLGVTFRRAAEKDIEPLSEIFAEAFGATLTTSRPNEYMMNGYQNPEHDIIVAAFHDGQPGGFVMTDINSFARGSLYIDQLAVAPGFQSYGLGRALMEQAEGIALMRGFNKIALHVRADNEKAIGLYASLGYKTVGTKWGYYEDGTSAHEMIKPLTAEAAAAANDNFKNGWGIARKLRSALGISLK